MICTTPTPPAAGPTARVALARLLALLLLVATAAGLAACGPEGASMGGGGDVDGDAPEMPIPPTLVDAHIVSEGEIASLLKSSGRLTASRRAAIVAKVSGEIVEVRGRPGLRVPSSAIAAARERDPSSRLDASADVSLLAVFDRSEARNAYREADLSRASAAGSLAIARHQRDRARGQAERARDLLVTQPGGIAVYSRDEVEALENTAQQAEHDVAVAEVAVELAETNVAEALGALEDGLVRAPFGGVVISGEPRVGEWVSAGTTLYEMADDDSLELRVFVTSGQAERVRLRQTASIASRHSGAFRYPATVVAVSPAVEAESGLVEVVLRVAPVAHAQTLSMWGLASELARAIGGGMAPSIPWPVPPSAPRLKPGMFVTATLVTVVKRAVVLPAGCVRVRQEQTYVDYIHPKTHRIERRQIQLDRRFRDDTRVTVMSGVAVGDRIVRTPQSLKEGTRVATEAELANWYRDNAETIAQADAYAAALAAEEGTGMGDGGWGDWAGFGGGQTATQVKVAPVVAAAVSSVLRSSGRLIAERAVTVAAQAGGTIGKLRVDTATFVDEGDTLAAYDNRNLVLALDQAVLTRRQRLTQLARELAIVRRARLEWFRASSLRDEDGELIFSEDEIDTARLTRIQAELTVDNAKVALRQAANTVAAARLRIDRARIRAPFAGYVTRLLVREGDQVSAGMGVAELVDPRDLRVDFPLTEAEAQQCVVGQSALVVSRGEVTSLFPATLTRIAPEVSPATGLVMITVRLLPWHGVQAMALASNATALARLLGPGGGLGPSFPFSGFSTAPPLRPGDFVGVEIAVAVHPRATLLPKASLQFERSRAHCFVAQNPTRDPETGVWTATAKQVNVAVDTRFATSDRVELVRVIVAEDANERAREIAERSMPSGGAQAGGGAHGGGGGGSTQAGAGRSGNGARDGNTNAGASSENARGANGASGVGGGPSSPRGGGARSASGWGGGAQVIRSIRPGDLVVVRQADLADGATITWSDDDRE